jgi:MFS family permease
VCCFSFKFSRSTHLNFSQNNIMVSNDQPSILWRQVWGLSAVLAAVTFSWMAYGFYQPKILQDLGFVEMAQGLGILQGFMGAVAEPIVGGLSDRVQHRLGNRLPMITLGVALAGLIFVGVALLLQWRIPVGIRWIVPVLMTLWVLSMIIFRGPVMALLMQAAPLAALPKANVILAMLFGLMGALGPLLRMGLQSAGASVTFLLGAIALTLGATLLYTGAPQHNLFAFPQSTLPPVSLHRIGAIFGVGLGCGLEINLLLRVFPQNFQTQFPTVSAEWLTAGILLVSVLVAIPMSTFTTKVGVKQSMLTGLVAIAVCVGFTLFKLSSIWVVGLFVMAGTAFGMVFSSQISFALRMVPSGRAGLGTGLYFGGIGAATAILSYLLLQWGNLGGTAGFGLTVGALCLASFNILTVKYPQRPIAGNAIQS